MSIDEAISTLQAMKARGELRLSIGHGEYLWGLETVEVGGRLYLRTTYDDHGVAPQGVPWH